MHFDCVRYRSHRPEAVSFGSARDSYNCIRHFCDARHFLHVVHTDDVRPARDAHGHRRGSAFQALIGGQVKCKADK